MNPSEAEAKRSPVGTTLGPADPLAAANCGLPAAPGACPEVATEPQRQSPEPRAPEKKPPEERAPEQKPEPHQHHHGAAAPQSSPAPDVADTKVTDPMCKMKIDPQTAAGGTLTVDGKQYWFCSTSCRRAFEAKNPGAK